MKRALFLMVTAIGLLLVTSCSNDETVVPTNSEAQVTFSLELEGGMNTRAFSDGTGVNRLHYAIFDKSGNIVESSKQESTNEDVPVEGDQIQGGQDNEVTFDSESEFTFSLVKGQQYKAIFWAYNKECTAYTVSDDMKTITVDYSGALNNDETRDAFFKTESFTVSGNQTINIVLKRALAQLNVGITDAEWNKAVAQGVTITQSKVEIKQAATTINLMDGTVGNPQDITFEASPIPADKEKLLVDINCDGDQEEYKYLSMCYFLAFDETNGSSKATLNDLKFTFSDDNGNNIVLEKGLDNAPVQRNHRTNIVTSEGNGGILTSDIDVTVMLDPLYDGEHNYTDENVWEEYKGIYTEEALAGKTILIPHGWHIRNGYILEPIPEYWKSLTNPSPLYDKSYTVNGQGYTVTFEPYGHEFVVKNAFAAINGAKVTVKDLNFAGEHFGVFGGVYGSTDYNTVFENVNIVNNGIYYYNKDGNIPASVFVNLGTATLNNCTINNTYWVGAEKDPNTKAETGINAYGGVYDIFIPNDGITNINNSTIGNIYVKNHGTLTVTGTQIDKIMSHQLVNGSITIKEGTEVTYIYVDQYSDTKPPRVNIEANATVGTLQLNSINKDNVIIDGGATIGKIIWKGTEYTTITDFYAAS